VTDREVLAFDLYGTLVDPIAVSSELDQVLGGSDGAPGGSSSYMTTGGSGREIAGKTRALRRRLPAGGFHRMPGLAKRSGRISSWA
jgi:hypothetical protein